MTINSNETGLYEQQVVLLLSMAIERIEENFEGGRICSKSTSCGTTITENDRRNDCAFYSVTQGKTIPNTQSDSTRNTQDETQWFESDPTVNLTTQSKTDEVGIKAVRNMGGRYDP